VNVSKPIYALLMASSRLAALVGIQADGSNGIYARVAPQAARAPFLVYEEISAVLQSIIDPTSPRLWESRIQLSAVAPTYGQMKAVLAAAMNACNYSRGVQAGVTLYSVVADSIGSENFDVGTQLYEQSCDLTVLYLDDGS
jgi:hypothetical protein